MIFWPADQGGASFKVPSTTMNVCPRTGTLWTR